MSASARRRRVRVSDCGTYVGAVHRVISHRAGLGHPAAWSLGLFATPPPGWSPRAEQDSKNGIQACHCAGFDRNAARRERERDRESHSSHRRDS